MLRRHFTSQVQSNSDSGGVPSFVDLGLSVMWASCNLGANSPEELCANYTHADISSNGILPLLSDPIYTSCDELTKWLSPRVPTVSLVEELLTLNKTEETLNGVFGIRFTSTNGNSIFIPNSVYWLPNYSIDKSGWITTLASGWSPSGIMYDNTLIRTLVYAYRGVCNALPQENAEFILPMSTVDIKPDTLYCITKDMDPTYFLSDTEDLQIYMSNLPFDNESALYTYNFRENNGQAFGLSESHVKLFSENLIDEYIYIKFNKSANITLSEWNASDCIKKSIPIYPNELFTITTNNKIVYRFKYADFEGYGFVLKWANLLTSLPTYVADTCTFELTTGDKHVIRYTNIREGKQMTIKPDVYAGWASRADADGYLYMRFNPDYAGNVTFVSEKPAT